MKALIFSASPNEIGLTRSCVDECMNELEKLNNTVEHICLNKKDLKRCLACGKRGWGICLDHHKCALKDDFNDLYNKMSEYDAYIFITPVYFKEMSEVAKTFFDRLKRCDFSNDESKIRGKKVICIAAAGGSGDGTIETLNSFDILNYFLKTNCISRIGITRFNFDDQKASIREAMRKL